MYNSMGHWRIGPEKSEANSHSDPVEGEETIDIALGIPMESYPCQSSIVDHPTCEDSETHCQRQLLK